MLEISLLHWFGGSINSVSGCSQQAFRELRIYFSYLKLAIKFKNCKDIDYWMIDVWLEDQYLYWKFLKWQNIFKLQKLNKMGFFFQF